MQILLITQESPLATDVVATGNAIRTAQLESALRRAGHTILQTWLDKQKSSHPDAFHNRDELHATIKRLHPDVILVSYWELLELLPFELPQAVIVDFVAPRPLEKLFEHPALVGPELQRLQRALSKCDVLLCGNHKQRDLLWYTLLQAGFDLRSNEPVLVVPLAAEPAGRPESDPRTSGWTLVSGGVHWPWRKSELYWQAIQDLKDDQESKAPRLILFGGQYRWQEAREDQTGNRSEDWPGPAGTHRETTPGHKAPGYQTQELVPYSHFSRFLLESAHIGLEVAQSNIERKFSQSFRSLEFLRHGLPLICNDYLPLARLVKQYEAGWTIQGPQDLSKLLQQIMNNPDEWESRSKNALRLVEDELCPDKACKPLLNWLEMPAKAARLPLAPQQTTSITLGKPPWPKRIKRQARLLRRFGLRQIFQPGPESGPRNNILIVTRSDLFPDDHGAAVKIVETARGLSQHGRRVGIVSDDRKYWWLFDNGHKQRCRLPFWLRLLSLPRSLTRLLHFSKDIPESNSFLYLPLSDNSFFWHCLYAAKQLNAGILQAEFPAYAKPCIEAREILNTPVVLVEHNVEYARLKAQVAELSAAQFRNLQAIEINLCNRSDAVICVSDNDRQQLLGDGVKPALLHTIPHGFKPANHQRPAMHSIRQDFDLPDNAVLIAFHGTFSYPPNCDALQVFAEILLPQLANCPYPFHLIAIGRNPPSESMHTNIHFTGSVDEVSPWLKGCDLAVIPLREGGGTRMKIIDCFAAGLPVISTSKGIEGIPVVNGREAIITDDWLSMSNEIMKLAESKKYRHELSAAALDFAAEMDWKSICSRYLNIFSAIQRIPK